MLVISFTFVKKNIFKKGDFFMSTIWMLSSFVHIETAINVVCSF